MSANHVEVVPLSVHTGAQINGWICANLFLSEVATIRAALRVESVFSRPRNEPRTARRIITTVR